MPTYNAIEDLQVDSALERFINEEALPGSGTDQQAFWRGLSELVAKFGPETRSVLAERARLQAEIDAWHQEHPLDPAAYQAFLRRIGYLVPEGSPFAITTSGVDPEIAEIPGPQLVVPVMNARYALNAANARWGSLYDALYGTDALGSSPSPGPYDPERGSKVIAWARTFLDEHVPLDGASHADVDRYRVADGALIAETDEGSVPLRSPSAFAGYQGPPEDPTSVFLVHHGLHVELVVDRSHPVGSTDRAGLADVVLEAAVTAIMDCEDSVAAVDAEDKVVAYRNWLGLMKGDLAVQMEKGGKTFTRRLADDRQITGPDGSTRQLRGRALMLVRNVGHLMTTPAVLDAEGQEISEGILDAVVTVLAAKHDLARRAEALNSKAGSVYVVKPKMHGPEEVRLTNDLFAAVENVLSLPRNTIKLGLMDEERRTTLNLAECLRASSERLVFINTGFLDRTGDEIHTSMKAGPVVRKAQMRNQTWFKSYEDHNVNIGLRCGLKGRAQIGKGMWAAPDQMADMLREKVGQPLAGASCAWVPSPTAATLHAVHYHQVDVPARQAELEDRAPVAIEDLLTLPIQPDRPWNEEEITAELENNAQGILGYVVRWIDQGIGCSKVPDIHDVALMEDRATCRISSQHMANWMYHGVVDRDRVLSVFRKMAEVVDNQNAGDPAYVPMAPSYDGIAFAAACALVLEGVEQPSGYTEPILHAHRAEKKRQAG